MKFSQPSIITKITSVFLVAAGVITLAAMMIYGKADERESYFAKMRFQNATKILQQAYAAGKPLPLEQLKLLDLEITSPPLEMSKKEESVIQVSLPKFYLDVKQEGHRQQVAVKADYGQVWLRDVRPQEKTKFIIIIGYFSMMGLLALLYLSIVRSIYPLKVLQQKIVRFGRGDFTVRCRTDRTDEIGSVANAFDTAIRKQKELMDARMLFLRNAAHELKTPLTKGMIALELPESPKKSQVLGGVFTRLDNLVRELMDIEKLTSGNIRPNPSVHRLEDVFHHAADLLFMEPEEFDHDLDDAMVKVDYRLTALALKNLMDNGIKYGNGEPVKIRLSGTRLEVANRGNPLSREFCHYLEPFAKETENQQGFGLGLFIVHHIALAQGMSFDYRYEEGWNVFGLELKNVMLEEAAQPAA